MGIIGGDRTEGRSVSPEVNPVAYSQSSLEVLVQPSDPVINELVTSMEPFLMLLSESVLLRH